VAAIELVDLLLVLWWYAGRYWGLPQIGLSRTLIGLVGATIGLLGLFVGRDYLRRRAVSLTQSPPKV
jgi:hypothetical protein